MELKEGTILPADIAIMGIGSTFYTDWLKETPIAMQSDGSIPVDKYLKTNIDNIYAGGDIAYAPVTGTENTFAAIGHYPLAHYHGKIAAMNICGKITPINSVPFFWTTLFGKSYRFAGHGKADKIILHGSLEKFEFFAYYTHNGKVVSMSSVGGDPVVADFANFMLEGNSLTEESITKDPFSWIRNKPKDLENRFKDVMIVKM